MGVGVGLIIGCIFWFTGRWACNWGLGGGGKVTSKGSLRYTSVECSLGYFFYF